MAPSRPGPAGASANFKDAERRWGERLARWRREVGASSCGVPARTGFLSHHLAGTHGIDCVVDIDPCRQGYFMAGTGQRIVGPVFLASTAPTSSSS